MKTHRPDGSLYAIGCQLSSFEFRLLVAKVIADQVIEDARDHCEKPETALAWAVSALVEDFEDMAEAVRAITEQQGG